MDNTLYVGLSRQVTLRREIDVIANNLANVDTQGFKLESMMLETDRETPRNSLKSSDNRPIAFVYDTGVVRDFTQGSMTQTGAPFDMAIDGNAFFKVSTAAGERYTRDGRFTLDPTGKLVTQHGEAVLDDGGGEIIVDPIQGPVAIGADGTMTQGVGQNTIRVGKVGLARFDDLSSLSKVGDNMFRNTANQPAQAAPDARIRQGMLESSNVKPVVEITRLIEVNRAYESITRTLDNASELHKNAVERLGKVN